LRRSYTISFPHLITARKIALAHQNNAIKASAIGRIIGRNREKANKKNIPYYSLKSQK